MAFPLMGAAFSCRGIDLFSLDLMSEGWYSGGSLIQNSFRSKTQAFMLGIQIALALFFLFTLAVKHAIIMVAFVGVSHPQRLLGSPTRL